MAEEIAGDLHKLRPGHQLISTHSTYTDVPSLSLCSHHCMYSDHDVKSSWCHSFSYDSQTRTCELSAHLSELADEQVNTTKKVFDVTGKA